MRFIIFCFLMSLNLFNNPVQASDVNLKTKDIPINACTINRTDKRKAHIALCAIFKDEAPFLKEWIEYHRVIGVEHFYLYNNMSQDHFWTILEPYVKEGVVELFDVPFDSSQINDAAKSHNFVQVTCYNHALKLGKKKNHWMAIIDSDEFICPTNGQNLRDVLKNYDYAAGLVIFWQIYGTSNKWDLAPGELMIESLLMKQPDAVEGLFKMIVKPKYAKSHDPHYCKVKKGKRNVTPDHHTFYHGRSYAPLLPIDTLRINHYTYRTVSYYELYKKPRKAVWGFIPSLERQEAEHAWANFQYDPAILPFVPALKERMK